MSSDTDATATAQQRTTRVAQGLAASPVQGAHTAPQAPPAATASLLPPAAAPAPLSTPYVDALLVLQKSDLARLAEKPELAQGLRLLFVDPGLLDEAAVRGLRDTVFRRLAPDPDFQARAATEAMTLATLVDLRLTALRAALWQAPGAAPSLHGWDVGLFFLALQRALVARQIGAQIEATFPERRIGVLRPCVVQQMYFDSFVSTDLVAQDPTRFAVLDSYEQTRWHRADAYDTVFDAAAVRTAMAGGRVSAITHVPTCFYDRAWLAGEVSRAHAFTLDLPSPFWDVPLHRGAALLRPLPSLADTDLAPGTAAAYRYAEAAAPVLLDCLGHLLPHPQARAQQVQAWSQRCRWQALNFVALQQALLNAPPQAPHLRPDFLLSDQDTGLNGPLFSVADALGSAITVVPHSGHPSMLLPHARRVVAVERAGYGCRPRSVLGQTVAVRAVRFGQHVKRRDHSRVKTLCLLLNSMQTEGLSHVDAHALAAFYRPLAALCEGAGVELILRPKPGAPALSVLSSALGVAPARLVQHVTQPLDQLAESTQLCIAYGEPTTGVAPFLDGGCLVLQVNEQRWPSDYTVCLPLLHDGVIPLLDHAQALQRVQALLADPARFKADTRQQNDAFRVRCREAHDHVFDAARSEAPHLNPATTPIPRL